MKRLRTPSPHRRGPARQLGTGARLIPHGRRV